MRPTLILIILISAFRSYCQKLTQDTVFIRFETDTLTNPQFSVEDVKDSRIDKELSSYNKRKFLILPVDVFVFPLKPLDSVLLSIRSANPSERFSLEIQNFYLSNRKGNFLSALVLEAKIGIYKMETDSLKFLGNLYYQSEYKKKNFLEKFPQSSENTLITWQKDFIRDMNTIAISGDKSYFLLSNLKADDNVKDLMMNINISGAFGIKWWLIDAELFFTSPEIKKRTVYIANIVRYQNHEDFESISYGWKSEHLQYRINKNWGFDGSGNILIGVNKWKNPDEIDPGLEQILHLNLSFTESLAYKPEKNHLYGRFGLIENMIYIYDYGFKLYPGLCFTLGTKF